MWTQQRKKGLHSVRTSEQVERRPHLDRLVRSDSEAGGRARQLGGAERDARRAGRGRAHVPVVEHDRVVRRQHDQGLGRAQGRRSHAYAHAPPQDDHVHELLLRLQVSFVRRSRQVCQTSHPI